VGGRNALDLVLTLELGRIIAADPGGYSHIVSKDTDFDSVVRHLKGETKLSAPPPKGSAAPPGQHAKAWRKKCPKSGRTAYLGIKLSPILWHALSARKRY